MKKCLTGLQPSGELTLGNLIGSINQIKKYQDNYDSYIFIPDLHSITVKQNPELLKMRIKKNIALYIAAGINPNKNTIYLQSENLYNANLSWILECITPLGQATRMTQFKDKSQKQKNINVGLLTYPILMAADIILYDADYVPVGIDQKQHVELARDIAQNFNNQYGETFKIPTPLIPEVGAKILDLQDPTKKMSKSEENPNGIIYLLDDVQTTRKKINKAVTDSENVIKYDEINKPGISNLLTIYSSLTNLTISQLEEKYKDQNYGTLKKDLAEVVCDFLTNLQTKYEKILNSNQINEILDKGIEKTNQEAKLKLEEIKQKMGLTR